VVQYKIVVDVSVVPESGGIPDNCQSLEFIRGV
jgi:hypothetical protein